MLGGGERELISLYERKTRSRKVEAGLPVGSVVVHPDRWSVVVAVVDVDVI